MIEISNKTRIGWIGTGEMGLPMCGHFVKAGYPVTLYDRVAVNAQPLVDQGAKLADSPKSLAEQCDVVFTIVNWPKDVRQVYLEDNGILSGLKPGSVTIDMTTTQPSLSVEVAEAAAQIGCYALDAPVSGGNILAKSAELSIMIGGDKAVVDAVTPLLNILGKNIIYQGAAGTGQHTKLCNQMVIATTMIGVVESLIYAAEAGLDLNTMLNSISRGAAGCWSLDNLAPRVVTRDFGPGFFVHHFVKDMGLALSEAKRMNLALPGLHVVEELYRLAREQGDAELGTAGLMVALEALMRGRE